MVLTATVYTRRFSIHTILLYICKKSTRNASYLPIGNSPTAEWCLCSLPRLYVSQHIGTFDCSSARVRAHLRLSVICIYFRIYQAIHVSINRSIYIVYYASVFLYYLLIFPLSHLCTSFKHGKCQHPINGPISFCHRQPPLKNYQLPGTWLTPSPTETAKLEGPHMFHHPFLPKLGFRLSQVGVPPTPTSHHHPKGSAGLSFATQKTLCCRIHILGGV